MELPDDPFEEGVHCDDACEAIGMAVLDCFAEGITDVLVTKEENGWGIWHADVVDDE